MTAADPGPRRTSPGELVVYDVVSLVLATVCVGAPAVATLAAMRWVSTIAPWWVVALGIPLWAGLFLVAMAAAFFVVRLVLPRLTPGRFPRPHRAWTLWAVHFILRRLWAQPPWSGLVMGQPLLRFLTLRALGARVAYDIFTALDTQFTDPQLLVIERGAMVAGGCVLGGHFVENDVLLLGVVHVGEGAQLLGGCKVGPGVTIGLGATLGPDCRIAPEVSIGRETHLGAGCQVSAGVKIGADVVIGHGVVIETDVELGDGSVVPSYARVPRKTRLDAGAKFKP